MQYVALLRGINTGRKMKMEDLRAVFESVGYQGVRTVLTTGNVIFETRKTAESTLTHRVEDALEKAFGYRIPAVIRTTAELAGLLDENPFAKIGLTDQTRPHVTFLKEQPKRGQKVPEGPGYRVLGIVDRAVCSVVDLSGGTTPDLMRVLDKTFGNEVTTRSWGTVGRIVKAAGAS